MRLNPCEATGQDVEPNPTSTSGKAEAQEALFSDLCATGQTPDETLGCSWTLRLWWAFVAFVTGQTASSSASSVLGWSTGRKALTGPTTGQVASVSVAGVLAFLSAGQAVASLPCWAMLAEAMAVLGVVGWADRLWWWVVVALVTGQTRP